ncbi:hypothetical protein AC579_6091 [Pseudocercospora musae]|uniref:Uncharacterized protein n=1 Tax=Pseudocercospora musae TaxID=113226 RepID=A0A139IAR1_9PEZI|nr:hypothetical protein AC579_6091 [Pseudocercospora musae]
MIGTPRRKAEQYQTNALRRDASWVIDVDAFTKHPLILVIKGQEAFRPALESELGFEGIKMFTVSMALLLKQLSHKLTLQEVLQRKHRQKGATDFLPAHSTPPKSVSQMNTLTPLSWPSGPATGQL